MSVVAEQERVVGRGAGHPAAIEACLDVLRKQAAVLRDLVAEQHTLVAGEVEAWESARRLSLANRINVICQRLQVDLVGAPSAQQWEAEVSALRALAEAVLRENPVLQARSPLSVVRAREIPPRHVLNRQRQQEVRKGFGLHRRPRNDEGLSVVIAYTPVGYEQMWHAHTVAESTLALDTRFVGRYAHGGIGALAAADGQMFHFGPLTYHTLTNHGGRPGRTFTLKSPLGISIWLPVLHLTGQERGWAEVLVAPWERIARAALLRRYQVSDSCHSYIINLAVLHGPGSLVLPFEEDAYVYVLDGQLAVRRGSQTVVASADDLVVAEPTPALRLRSPTDSARIYWASGCESRWPRLAHPPARQPPATSRPNPSHGRRAAPRRGPGK